MKHRAILTHFVECYLFERTTGADAHCSSISRNVRLIRSNICWTNGFFFHWNNPRRELMKTILYSSFDIDSSRRRFFVMFSLWKLGQDWSVHDALAIERCVDSVEQWTSEMIRRENHVTGKSRERWCLFWLWRRSLEIFRALERKKKVCIGEWATELIAFFYVRCFVDQARLWKSMKKRNVKPAKSESEEKIDRNSRLRTNGIKRCCSAERLGGDHSMKMSREKIIEQNESIERTNSVMNELKMTINDTWNSFCAV